MSELHPVEAAWRRFRKSDRYELLAWARAAQQSYLDFLGLKRCPPEIALPWGVVWNRVTLDEARARVEQTRGEISVDGALLVNTIHVWAAYREAKTIYTIEPALAECLSRSPWPAATPTAALRLSSRCPILSIPRGDTTIHLAATYDLVTGDELSGALELHISQYEDDLWVPQSVLQLTRETLSECVAAADAAAARSGSPEGLVAQRFTNPTAGLALTLLLYLGGEPDIVREVHPGERPMRDAVRRRDPERWADLHYPVQYSVGSQFRRAIERWEIEHAREPGDPTGRHVRPHLRRAHSHLYWTGKGRKLPRVRFLLPISVRGGRLIEEPEHPSETRVR
jgi:hypothetical protein